MALTFRFARKHAQEIGDLGSRILSLSVRTIGNSPAVMEFQKIIGQYMLLLTSGLPLSRESILYSIAELISECSLLLGSSIPHRTKPVGATEEDDHVF
jgi:hypothetical protein